MTFNGLNILFVIFLIAVFLILPFFLENGWFRMTIKVISILIISIIILAISYTTYQYYSLKDVPLDNIEAQNILDKQVDKYKTKSYTTLMQLIHPNEPDNYEIIGNSNTTYQIDIQSMWLDEKGGDLLVFLSIDNGYRSVMSPLTATFEKQEH